MNVKFYSLTSLPAAVAGAAGSFVNVTAGENAGMYYCTGDRFIRLDNVAQDRTGEINAASIDTATGVVSFKHGDVVKFTVSLADYLAAEVAKLSGSATIASVAGGVVTIKAGVSEADGKISNAAGDDITLAKVATTGKAADVALDPIIGISNTDKATVQDAIAALATAFDGLVGDTNNALATTLASAKTYASEQDAITLQSAKDYADGLADNYDAAGAAATALSDAKSYADAQDAITLQSAKDYADGLNTALDARLDVIEGEGEGSIKKAAADAVAAVVAGADSDFDTLKEVADWIMSDTTGAAKLQTDVAGLKTDVSTLQNKVSTLEGASHTHDNKAELDKIVDGDKAKWDAHVANADIHVTAEQKNAWTAKQDALTNASILAGITAEKVASWDGAVSKAGVTSVGGKAGAINLKGDGVAAGSVNLSISDSNEISAVLVGDFVEKVDGKGLSTNDLTDDLKAGYDTAVSKAHEHNNFAVLQQITSASTEAWNNAISDINNHIIDTDPHVTTADKAKWNAAEQNAKDYADTQDAATLASAKDYTDAALTWLSEFPVA